MQTFPDAMESRSYRQTSILGAPGQPAKAFLPVPNRPHGSYNRLGTPCSVRIFLMPMTTVDTSMSEMLTLFKRPAVLPGTAAHTWSSYSRP